MFHVFVGTKAQLIKMAPLLREMENRGVDYNFIFSGQHQETIKELRKNFGIKDPDIILHKGKDITSIPKMILWMIKIVAVSFVMRKALWKGDSKGIVLNHGDTFSTLLGTILARLAGHDSAHVESGLRSYNLWSPFPEEITRLIVFSLSTIYFAPDEWASKNLRKYKGRVIITNGNTLYDALQVIKRMPEISDLVIPSQEFAIASFHRFENIFKESRLIEIVEILELVSKRVRVLVIMHKPTLERLKKYHLFERLAQNINIEIRPRYDYLCFIQLLRRSEFLITDGGSNQEECFYLGKPCLLLRCATERQEGLGENAHLCFFKKHIVNDFVNNYTGHVRQEYFISPSPSEIIVDSLLAITGSKDGVH